jgi:hypothetical protein
MKLNFLKTRLCPNYYLPYKDPNRRLDETALFAKYAAAEAGWRNRQVPGKKSYFGVRLPNIREEFAG